MKIHQLLFFVCMSFGPLVWAQPTSTVDPQVFTAEDEITLSVDVTGTSLANHTGDVWIWAWIFQGCSSNCDAPTNVNPANGTISDALMQRDANNPNVYTISFVPTEFFAKAPAEIQKIGFKLKSQDWADNKQSDVDIILNVEPLVFTPKVSRTFPTKVTQHDVITLYLDQKLAVAPALKYELSDFTVAIEAYNANDEMVGSVVTKDAVNQGNGEHYIRIIPTYDFETVGLDHLRYRFISKNNAEVESEWFDVLLLDLN